MKISPFIFDKTSPIYRADDEIVLIDKPKTKHVNHPVKLKDTISILCLKGHLKGRIDMRYFEEKAPCFVILLAEHTTEIEHISADFTGIFNIMSKNFTDGLNINDGLSAYFSLLNKPSIAIKEDELADLTEYFDLLKKIMCQPHKPFKTKIIQHVIAAHFYDFGYYYYLQNGKEKSAVQNQFVKKFLDQVQIHFKRERHIGFYADKLCLTPKYLSKAIKEHTGQSAKQWIDGYVIWEAKVLLKSTTVPVQEISEALNFSSQSFFGKYFKRSTHLSPTEYRYTFHR